LVPICTQVFGIQQVILWFYREQRNKSSVKSEE
jgi:hypothetical protein